MTQQLTKKSDAYSFGVAMLELVTATVARAIQQPARNPIDATEKYHTITRTRNERQFAYIFRARERELY